MRRRPYATKLLADSGADVIKVEQPTIGDPARGYGPFPKDEPDIERSGLFLHLNDNKRSITLNLESGEGRLMVLELARWADVVVESFSPGIMDGFGLGDADLAKANPRASGWLPRLT